MAFVTVRAIVQPPRTGHRQFIQQVNAVLDKFAQSAKQDLESPEATWKNHATQFAIVVTATANSIGRSVSTDNPIYFFLDGGTRVRRAALSFDYVPKTRIRSLKSGAGAGRVLKINKAFDFGPIDARLWTDEVRRKSIDAFVNAMQKVASDSARH